MKMGQGYEVVEFTHPEMGTCIVTFKWAPAKGESFRWVPTSVEFDFFTPHEQQEVMAAELLASQHIDDFARLALDSFVRSEQRGRKSTAKP